jgi:hypothetical protein
MPSLNGSQPFGEKFLDVVKKFEGKGHIYKAVKMQ